MFMDQIHKVVKNHLFPGVWIGIFYVNFRNGTEYPHKQAL